MNISEYADKLVYSNILEAVKHQNHHVDDFCSSKALLNCLRLCLRQEEDEVPDDETVNQMIARSEDEFDQFMVSVHFL